MNFNDEIFVSGLRVVHIEENQRTHGGYVELVPDSQSFTGSICWHLSPDDPMLFNARIGDRLSVLADPLLFERRERTGPIR